MTDSAPYRIPPDYFEIFFSTPILDADLERTRFPLIEAQFSKVSDLDFWVRLLGIISGLT